MIKKHEEEVDRLLFIGENVKIFEFHKIASQRVNSAKEYLIIKWIGCLFYGYQSPQLSLSPVTPLIIK